MTQSIQNFDNRNNGYGIPQNSQHQKRAAIQAVRIPDYYTPDDKQSFLDMFKESPIYTMGIRAFFGPLIDHPIASLFTWFGCGWLLDKYTNAGGGEYDKSLFKKIVNFGDNIQNSKLVQSKPVQTVLDWFKKGSKKGGSIIDKNSVLKAMRDTPTMPELEIVKSEMLPQRQRIVHDFNLIMNELCLNKDGYARLNKLDLNKSEKEALKKVFKVPDIKDIPDEKASSYIQLKRLGKSEDFIKQALNSADHGISVTKSELLKEMGKDADWIKAVHEDTIGKYVNEVQDVTKKLGNRVRVSMGDFKPLGMDLGILTTPTKRVVSCDNIYNRLFSLDGGAKTATGRFMSRLVQMIHRGLTFGGGKLGVLLFIAPAFVETAINVHKAEPNEKIGTGVNNLVGHISWVFTFPLALQIMHHIAGAKNAGLSKERIQQIRKLQGDFNKKNKLKGSDEAKKLGDKADVFKNYAEYNAERKKVNEKMKKLRVVKGQKWYTKCIRWLSGILTPDLGKLDAYNPGNIVTKTFSQMRNLPRNIVGVPIRLLIFGLLAMGALDTAINKTLKLFFGGSYDSMKEEERKDAKKEQKKFLKEDLTERLYDTQRKKILEKTQNIQKGETLKFNNQQIQGQNVTHKGVTAESDICLYSAKRPEDSTYENNKINNNSNPNILQNATNSVQQTPLPIIKQKRSNIDNYTYIPSQENIIKGTKGKINRDNYTYIPSQNSRLNAINNNTNGIRTYVPSQRAANIQKNWDNSGLQSALERADRAEKRALKLLAGDFDDMPK